VVVSVPQLGIMRSHNVATACSIVLWEYNRQRLMDMSCV
jgi:tRNA G18 (ribose-2'-O)-methylase SpoU